MKKLLLFVIAFMITMSSSHAEAFTFSFNDLAVGTDVLESYKDTNDITFTTGLYVINEGAYKGQLPNQGAEINGSKTVKMSIPEGTDLLSFYFNGSATLKAYDFYGGLVFEEIPQPWTTGPWSVFGEIFKDTVYEVDFIVSEGNFLQIDPLTNDGIVIPEPSTCLLLLFGILGMAGMKKKAWKG
jgi:hypothetical protein